MRFTQLELRQKLVTLGVPAWAWQLPDMVFETIDDDFPAVVWEAWIESLRLNAPELLVARDIGGGKTRLVPKWIEEAGDCDDHALIAFAHFLTGNWLNAVRGGPRVARTLGPTFYIAEPRAENLNRAGPHSAWWYINHAGELRIFETGDGNKQVPTQAEIISMTFGVAA